MFSTIIALTMSALQAAAPVEVTPYTDVAAWKPVLQALVHTDQLDLGEDLNGKFEEDGKEIRVKLVDPVEVKWPDGDYLFASVVFLDEIPLDGKEFATGKAVLKERKHQDVAIAVNRARPDAFNTRVIGEHSFYCQIQSQDIGDWMNRGDLQVKLEAISTYLFNDPTEVLRAYRILLLSFPELKPIFAGTQRASIVGTNYVERCFDQVISFGASEEGKVRPIELRDRDGKLIRTIPYENGRYVYDEEVLWKRDPKAVEARIPPYVPFTVRTVDEAGNPIPGIPIAAYDIGVNGFTFETTAPKTTGKTDADGRFKGGVQGGLQLVIEAEGYYRPDNIDLPKGEIPKEEMVVVLRKYDTPVPLFTGSGRMIVDLKASRIGFHLDRGGAGKSFEGDADLFIQMTPLIKAPNILAVADKDWRFEIAGGKRWELVPAPKPWNRGKQMYVAPESGYKDTWQFNGTDIPEEFYLHCAKDNRYGKLFSLKRYAGGYLIFEYAVQAEPVGTRSLNAVGFDMGAWDGKREQEKIDAEFRAREEEYYRNHPADRVKSE